MKKQFFVLVILIYISLIPFQSLALEKSIQINQISTTRYPSMNVFFSVPRNRINGLINNNQVTFTEDGISIEQFSLNSPRISREATSTVLLIDRSGSMAQSMQEVKEAAKLFINELGREDQASIISFTDKITEHIMDTNQKPTFSSDHYLLTQAINSIPPGIENVDQTTLYDALLAGINLSNQSKIKNKAVVVLTDAYKGGEKSKSTIENCIKLAKQNTIPVYCIGLGQDINSPPLQKIAKETNGTYFYTPTTKELQSIYLDLSKTIQQNANFPIGTVMAIANTNTPPFKNSMITIFESINTFFLTKYDKDPVLLVTYNNQKNPFLSQDPDELQREVSRITLSDTNRVFDLLSDSIQYAKMLSSDRKSVILFVTDSDVNDESIKTKKRCIFEAVTANIPVYVLAVGKPDVGYDLKDIAEKSGGEYYPLYSASDVPLELKNLSDKFQQEYKIEFLSKLKPTYFSKTHYVKINISTNQDALTAKKGFFFIFPNQKSPVIVWIGSIILLFIIIGLLVYYFTANSKRNQKNKCPICGYIMHLLDIKCPKCGYRRIHQAEEKSVHSSISESENTIPFYSEENEKTRIVNRKKGSLAWIIFVNGMNKNTTFDIGAEGVTTIGRDSTNHIMIDDASISRKHAKFLSKENEYFIHDLGSGNGTFVNQKEVEHIKLNDGDRITLGEQEMIFVQVKGGKK